MILSWFINFSQTNLLFNRVKICLKFVYSWINLWCLENFQTRRVQIINTVGYTVGYTWYSFWTDSLIEKLKNCFASTFTQKRLPTIHHGDQPTGRSIWSRSSQAVWKFEASSGFSAEYTPALFRSHHTPTPQRLRFPFELLDKRWISIFEFLSLNATYLVPIDCFFICSLTDATAIAAVNRLEFTLSFCSSQLSWATLQAIACQDSSTIDSIC